jgi:hypothetical protein
MWLTGICWANVSWCSKDGLVCGPGRRDTWQPPRRRAPRLAAACPRCRGVPERDSPAAAARAGENDAGENDAGENDAGENDRQGSDFAMPKRTAPAAQTSTAIA